MVGSIYKNRFKPDIIALKYKDDQITYEQLDQNVQKYATYLAKSGVKKGDRVLLSSINSPEFIYSYLGAAKIGAVIVPVNLLLTMDEIKFIIKNSDAKTMIFHPFVIEKMKGSKKSIKHMVFTMLQNKYVRKTIKELAGIDIILLDKAFKNEINSITNYEFDEVDDQSLISTFLYTSGTTGKPKAAMLTHKNLMTNAHQCSEQIALEHEDCFICVLPMFHAFAFTACVLLPLYSGCSISIMENFQPKELIDTLKRDEVTVFCGVPSMYIVLLNALKSNISFPKLRLAVSGGASIPVEILRQVKEKLQILVLEGYGLSEASPVVTFNPIKGKQKEGSIGLPLSGIQCRIIDENGNDMPKGEPGELIAKGDNVMLGYYKQPEQTNETLKDGWLHTGDVAKFDEDGYLYIVERKKDLIIVGGLNVYPREVEEVIYTYPKVKETAVVGIEDNLRGEYVKAFVVLKEGEKCHSKDLLKYLKDHLALYKMPREIEFLDELPKNGTGKVLKKILREQYNKTNQKKGEKI